MTTEFPTPRHPGTVKHYVETDTGHEVFMEHVPSWPFTKGGGWRVSTYLGEEHLDMDYSDEYEDAKTEFANQVAKFGGGYVPW